MSENNSSQSEFSVIEDEILSFWEQNQIFLKSMKKNEGSAPYIIYDGPPTANANPPLHTIVPMSFKDLVGRYQTMKGRYVPRQAGWDTHGLPVEVQVEKALGLTSKKDILNLVPGDEVASIEKFNRACRDSVWEFKKEWDKFVPRVGYWTDTQNPYITYQPEYIEKVWGVFKNIWEKGLVYKGYKVLPYCPRCGTALSSAEVAQEYQMTRDVSVLITFPLSKTPQRSFLAWTTTPWTLPGNVALAVGKEIDYVVVKQADQEYILAKSRLSILKGDYVIIEECKGEELIGLTYEPLYPEVLEGVEGKKFEVVAADFVTTEDGSGIVHTAVMYGEDDFLLGQKEGLAMSHSVGLDGHFLPNIPLFAGQYVRDALGALLSDLQQKERLYAKETISHSYPFCWRCKTALIYYAKDSWFVAMSTLRNQLVANNNQVEWFPEHIKNGRFGDFVREARDWAVSRERFWGTPLPVWVAASGKMLCVGNFDELRALAKNPEKISQNFDPHRPFIDAIILEQDGEEYRREPVVLDVWFDSGSMPYASGKEGQGQFPADYIAEAIDQTRGWFYVLQAISTIVKEQTPYRRVVCMGHLVDAQGKKMSKSGPNSVNPEEIFTTVGVDAVRWFLYTVNSPGESKAFSLKEVQVAFRKSLLLLWNVFNYFTTYAALANFTYPSLEEREELRTSGRYGGKSLTLLDQWIVSRMQTTTQQVGEYMEEYDFMRAGRLLEASIDDLSTWYLRRSRKRNDQLFFAVLYEVIMTLISLLAPFTPFLTEKIYQSLKTKELPESLHLTDWLVASGKRNISLEENMQKLRQIVELGLAVRASEKIKVRQPLRTLYVQRAEVVQFLEQDEWQNILREELNIKEKELIAELEAGYPAKSENELSIALVCKLDEELIEEGRARELLRQIQQLRKEIGLQPGEIVGLWAGAQERSVLEPLLNGYPHILQEAFLQITPETWQKPGSKEIVLEGQTLFIELH